jgi:hypothetical protein
LTDPVVVDGLAGTAEVRGSLQFTDAGGDLAFLVLSSPGQGTTTVPLPGAEGITSGSGSATITLAPTAYGTLVFEVWLVDRAGASSNHLSGSVTLVPEDDGTRWTQVSALLAAALVHAGAGSHARYVAVGSGGLLLASDDGKAWVQQTSPVTASLHGVAWSGSRFAAVGDDSTILTSDDGHAWVARASPVAGTRLYAVSWGGGGFVAVGGQDYGPPVVLRSADGVSWGQGAVDPSPVAPAPLYDVAWGNGRWVAVGASRWVSTDGASWSVAPGDYPGSYGFAVGWNGAQFVTVGAVKVGVSADGLTWSSPAGPLGFNYWGLAWSGYHWLALSAATPDAATSADGLAWTDHWLTLPLVVPKVIWDGDRFPARWLAAGGGIWTSP